MSLFKHLTRRSVTSLLMAVLVSFSISSFANDDSARKIKSKVTPSYPEVARQMHVSGIVRLEVEVASSGAVKSVKALGGHPLLIEAATAAVKQWKYEAGAESTTIVEFKFNAEQ
ncbi:MAG: energy transducer TonB [Terriglobales bacterium]